MANLKEQEKWEDGVYQIEENDPVLGGENGVTNKPIKQLANRTSWLKKALELFGKKSVPKDLTVESTSTADESGHSHKLPVGSTTEKGIWQATSDTGIDSDGLVLTAKAGKKLAQMISLVQLALNNYITNSKKSSAVNSNTADTVATSAAVKTAYDKGVEAKTAADNANNNANGRVSKSGDTMTGDFSIKNGDWGGINLFNRAGKYTRLEVSPDASRDLLTLVYRDTSGRNQSVVTIPKRSGEVLLNTDITSSLSNNGWCKLPNGLIMQWGISNGGWVNFPIAFPHQCFSVIGTPNGGGNYENYIIFNISNTRFFHKGKYDSDANNAKWIAIGN